MKTFTSTFLSRAALAGMLALAIAACSKPAEPVVVAAAPPAPAAPATTVGTDIDDGVITASVKSALLSDADIKSFDFKVETRKGQVQISGFVDSQANIDSAIAAAKKIEGVKGVDNGMTVKDGKASVGNTVDDGVITSKVKSALLADPAVKSFDVAVQTRMGVVQLSGFANDQAQIARAVEIAKAVDGVKSVSNEMSVKK